jgi:hypothetical protein
MLGIDNPGIDERRSDGADDETTGRNFEGDGEEDQLDGRACKVVGCRKLAP